MLPTGIALQTRPAPQQSEIPEVAAGFEVLGLAFGVLFGGKSARFDTGPGH